LKLTSLALNLSIKVEEDRLKKINIILIALVFILMSSSFISYACTSFAVFSDNNLYGMNFDYPETEIKLIIHRTKAGKAFSMEFKQGNEYFPFAGMNSKGLFVAVQMLYPEKKWKKELEKNEIYIGELGGLIGEYEKVEQIEQYIEDKKLVNMPITVHQLFADKSGGSMIVEAGEDGNRTVKTKKDFVVMTNFSNFDFIGKTYNEVYGAGDSRYKAAYEYIKENFDRFNLESGWEILKRTAQASGGYETQCSMMFDPQKGDVYIALKRDFEKIWKISLENETIESVKGFKEPIEIKIETGGILVSELMSDNKNASITSVKLEETKALDSTNTSYWILGLGFMIFTFVLIGVIHKNKKAHSKEE